MNTNDPRHATQAVTDAINDLLDRNERTAGAQVKDLYLGDDLFVAQLHRPVVIEGRCETVDKTADLFDLMDMHDHDQ